MITSTGNAQIKELVDQEAASKARKRAMQLALEESELAHEYGNEISNFIDEGFNMLK